ncbi:MAG: M48 family metalloprotease [Acidobacteria bacterium]|nr:M48 family metalloprotease [Acidobacteriota bacterium]
MIICAKFSKRRALPAISLGLLILLLSPFVYGQRTRLEPGFNLFSVQQDVELGRNVAQDAESKLPMLNNDRVDNYLNRLGKKLAAYAPGEKYPYQFKCVNDSSVNAFALPGGFLYINRGVIEAADNEAELAGVVGHEIGHVALRHGTNQASKAQVYQAPLAILGSVLGGDSMAAALAQLGGEFAVNSVLLKYSRDAERQADLIGTQILFDTNYNPVYMARFFEKLEAGNRGTDFFSSHPHPENRIDHINAEIARLGSYSRNRVNDTGEFREIKRLLQSLPPAPKQGEVQAQAPSGERRTSPSQTEQQQEARPPAPSNNFRRFYSENLKLQYPENWKIFGHEKEFTLAPEGGILRSADNSALAYGVEVSLIEIPEDIRSDIELKEATDRLIVSHQESNPAMRLIRDRGRIRVDGRRGLSRIYENESPVGGREIVWIVTVLRAEGLMVFAFVAPERHFDEYDRAFEKILDSVDF